MVPDFSARDGRINALKVFVVEFLQRAPCYRATQYFEQSGVNLANFDPVSVKQLSCCRLILHEQQAMTLPLTPRLNWI